METLIQIQFQVLRMWESEIEIALGALSKTINSNGTVMQVVELLKKKRDMSFAEVHFSPILFI